MSLYSPSGKLGDAEYIPLHLPTRNVFAFAPVLAGRGQANPETSTGPSCLNGPCFPGPLLWEFRQLSGLFQ